MAATKEQQIWLWHTQYYSSIVGFFRRRIANREDAEDLAQEVFLKCTRAYDTYDPEKCPAQSWLFVIADNCLKDYLRYHGRRPSDSLEEHAENHPDAYMDDSMQQATDLMEKRAILKKALDQLPDNYKRALVLQYFGGYTTQQIADELGVNPGNARAILSRAMKRMRELLANEEV